MSDSNIKVCVRVRPFNKREKSSQSIVRMYQNATILTPPQHPDSDIHKKVFTFDHSFWSIETPDNTPPLITQEEIYTTIGSGVARTLFEGYNGSIMAYGQSGSGKTHTMMGSNSSQDRGIIPRLCFEIFERISLAPQLKFEVHISYLEIYAEQIRDLLDPSNNSKLRMREHPDTGPYVDGLTQISVKSQYEVDQFMMYGNQHRVTAETKLNDRSSRSHAIFMVAMEQKDPGSKEKLYQSKLCLVDLAGSERVKDSGVTGVHLKEAANINKSLTTLGRVISILSQNSSKSSTEFVPFRDSILTWLLKDTLGGNSKTVMIATISPSAINYDETLNTLQYAYKAKQIVNKVTVNAGKNDLLIARLRTDLDFLQQQWELIHKVKFNPMTEEYETIQQNLRGHDEIAKKWEESTSVAKEMQSQSIRKYSEHADTIQLRLQDPFLFNVTPTTKNTNEPLIQYIPQGQTKIRGVILEHDDQGVWLIPNDDVLVNGVHPTDRIQLEHLDKIVLGDSEFKFKIPICAIKT